MKTCTTDFLNTLEWPLLLAFWPFCIFFWFMLLLVIGMILSVCFCFPCYFAGLCGKRRKKLHGRKKGKEFCEAFSNALCDVLCSNRPDYDYIFKSWSKYNTRPGQIPPAHILIEEGRYKIELPLTINSATFVQKT